MLTRAERKAVREMVGAERVWVTASGEVHTLGPWRRENGKTDRNWWRFEGYEDEVRRRLSER